MPKVKIFLWQYLCNALPLRGNLLKKVMTIDPLCPLCGEDIETTCLFWECSFTKSIWDLAQQHNWLPLHDIPCNQQCSLQIIKKFRQNSNPNDIRKLAFLLWSIWKGRNAFVFQHQHANPIRIIINAKKAFGEWRIRSCMSDDFSSTVVIS